MPVGRSRRVAGSSFIAVSMTSAKPAAMPGAARGRETSRTTPNGPRPSERATSPRLRGLCATAERTEPMAAGMNSTVYASTRRGVRW